MLVFVEQLPRHTRLQRTRVIAKRDQEKTEAADMQRRQIAEGRAARTNAEGWFEDPLGMDDDT